MRTEARRGHFCGGVHGPYSTTRISWTQGLQKQRRLAVDAASRFFVQLWNLEVLPVSAAVAASPTVESAATVKSATSATTAVESAGASAETSTSVESAATAEAPTIMEAATESAAIKAAPAKAASAKATSPAIETTPAAEAASVKTAAIKTTTVETIEPRACADKEAVYKVLWTVETVRRAIIRVIAVVAVGAHRSWTVVAWANPNSKRNLSMRRSRRRERANGQ